MDWYHLADRTKRDTSAKWVQGWSVGRGSAKIRKESKPQTNPLLDNYEGMAITAGRRGASTVRLISDDNFGATQIARVLTLTARL